MATIETFYRCRIDYTWKRGPNGEWINHASDGTDAVEDRAFQFSYKEPKVKIEAFSGGAACLPYITLESENRKAVERLAGKIERYINRRKDVKLGDSHGLPH